MSFQDVGKSSTRRKQPTAQAALGGSVTDSFAQISNEILQYQKNVGLLEKIVKQVGIKTHDHDEYNLLETQYKVQLDVLQQIGNKIETQLKEKNNQIATYPSGDEQSKRRTTIIKLSKDFNRVQQANKNLQLEYRRRITNAISNKKLHQQQQATNSYGSSGSGNGTLQQQQQQQNYEQQQQIQLQIQQDTLNTEIMKEREEEIRNINRGMNQVNEIYKDLANIVGSQQEQIDQVETQMEQTKITTEQGLSHIQKANEHNNASQCVIS